MIEEWKNIDGYAGLYKISNVGNVLSLKSNKILKHSIRRGYHIVGLRFASKLKFHSVHILAWDHFGDKERQGTALQVDHIDSNKNNNAIDNLQLLTGLQNTLKVHIAKTNMLTFTKVQNKLRVRIRTENGHKHLGYFDNRTDALCAYKKGLQQKLTALAGRV